MTKKYRDYFWREGIPYGIDAIDDKTSLPESYKIVMDPYRKRISIEKYAFDQFLNTLYDSALLNFRYLNQIEQQSWQKVPIKESEETIECLIRDQDDRVIFLETYIFQNQICKKCIARSPQGIILSYQEMRYKHLGDPDNEVILYDSNKHPVMKKIYETDPHTFEFTNLIFELRDMQGMPTAF